MVVASLLVVSLLAAAAVGWRGGPIWLASTVAGLGAAGGNLVTADWALSVLIKAGGEALMVGATVAMIMFWWQDRKPRGSRDGF